MLHSSMLIQRAIEGFAQGKTFRPTRAMPGQMPRPERAPRCLAGRRPQTLCIQEAHAGNT